ncbi:hypothetical protein SAMN05428951_101693 [Pseudomonas sp. OV546]|nr:hypothetical protein SAMN05428951_101693 [Pseudomonas sp. OV546]
MQNAPNNRGVFLCGTYQQVQHIIGMPLQLIIIGMAQSFIILFMSMQQFSIMAMLMPGIGIGIILHIILSPIRVHSITHFIIGIGMPIMGIMFMPVIMAMASADMHIIDMLAHCIIIGMPQFIIIAIISALVLN